MANDSGRHAKMFDLLRQGDLDCAPIAETSAVVPQYADEDAASSQIVRKAIAARYVDEDTAHQMIARGKSSFRVPGWLNQSRERATQRTALFLTRQTG